MTKHITGICVAIILCCVWAVQAQKSQPQSQARKKVVYKGRSFLQGGQYGDGRIPKRVFDSLIAYALVSKDSLQQEHTVDYFMFSYAERGAFEDSTGKLRVMTDYYATASDKGKLPPDWLSSIRERSKAGDTASFYNIVYYSKDTTKGPVHSAPIKLIITD